MRNAERAERGGGIFINATEMYLRTIFVMTQEPGGPPRALHLARRLGITPPSVREHLLRLVDDGLVVLDGPHAVGLTEEGRHLAVAVIRKHCLAERLMVDVIGLSWELAHVESMRWQHVISDRVAQKLVSVLKDPLHSPYGDPIPADDPTDDGANADRPSIPAAGEVGLDELLGRGPRRVRIRRILEPLQADESVLLSLRGSGVTPGTEVHVGAAEDDPGLLLLRHPHFGSSTLTAAQAVWVRAVPLP